MGLLIDGVWLDNDQKTKVADGRFVRTETQFRNWITADGAPGPTGPGPTSKGGFKAEPGRYHLYVSYACPWAHRTLIFRKLKKLEDLISVSVVHWIMGTDGWTFAPGPGVVPDPINDADYLHQVYTAVQSDYSGRVTVPVLWDKETGTIVNNESAEIIRMLNSAFDGAGADAALDFYPEDLRAEIDAINGPIYEHVNNGVYKSGFATSRDAYEDACRTLFAELDRLETRLAGQRYLAGDRVTEADWRLFTTLVRFDPVYAGHFKCNLRRLVDYPNLWNYTRALYQVPGVAETVNMTHIKQHYYGSHRTINPTGIVPLGPEIDFTAPHDRDRFAPGAAA